MKQIIFYIIAIIGAFALYFWKENEILAAGFVALVLYIAEKFKTNELKAENKILKVMHKAEMRRNNLNLGNMATNAQLEILKGQAEWIRDYGDTHPEEAQLVLLQQIDNLEIILKGSTLNPSLTVPPPPPN